MGASLSHFLFERHVYRETSGNSNPSLVAMHFSVHGDLHSSLLSHWNPFYRLRWSGGGLWLGCHGDSVSTRVRYWPSHGTKEADGQ